MKDQKYEQCMLDIETLDTASSAVVLSIGAVAFSLVGNDNEDSLRERRRCFYAPLKIQIQLDMGRTINESTLQWWMQQSDQARTVFTEPRGTVLNALLGLNRFCETNGIKYMWGNGNTFDNVVVRSLYQDSSIPGRYPIDFRSDMDLRTYRLAAGSPAHKDMNIQRIGTHHNALDDAKYQVLQAQLYHQIIES